MHLQYPLNLIIHSDKIILGRKVWWKISTLWFLSGSNWRWVLLEQGQQRQQLSNLSQEEKIGGRWGKLYTEYFSHPEHKFPPEYSPEICTDCTVLWKNLKQRQPVLKLFSRGNDRRPLGKALHRILFLSITSIFTWVFTRNMHWLRRKIWNKGNTF